MAADPTGREGAPADVPDTARPGADHIEVELAQSLGLAEALTIGIGTMIGAGIFVLPGFIIAKAGPAAVLSFLLGGLVAARDAALELLAEHRLEGLGELEVVGSDGPVSEIVDRCGQHDLAVVGAVTRPTIAKAIFGDAARKVAERAPCSVLVARSGTSRPS